MCPHCVCAIPVFEPSMSTWRVHRNPLLCAHFHLGLWLMFVYTVGGKDFPDPRNREEWFGCPFWAAPNGQVPTYEALRKPLGYGFPLPYKPSKQFSKLQPVVKGLSCAERPSRRSAWSSPRGCTYSGTPRPATSPMPALAWMCAHALFDPTLPRPQTRLPCVCLLSAAAIGYNSVVHLGTSPRHIAANASHALPVTCQSCCSWQLRCGRSNALPFVGVPGNQELGGVGC